MSNISRISSLIRFVNKMELLTLMRTGQQYFKSLYCFLLQLHIKLSLLPLLMSRKKLFQEQSNQYRYTEPSSWSCCILFIFAFVLLHLYLVFCPQLLTMWLSLVSLINIEWVASIRRLFFINYSPFYFVNSWNLVRFLKRFKTFYDINEKIQERKSFWARSTF